MNNKNELKSAMEALNVRLPLRLNVKAPAFQAPAPSIAPKAVADEVAASVFPTSSSPVTEESGSNLNPVHFEQGSKSTLSKIDSVQSEPRPNWTGSKMNPVEEPSTQPKRSTLPFTQVPHELLRGEGRFTDPLDFMIYLHLYSYSWGFSRETASMSQGQLERFTGSARNTVRRSLERLIQQGWVKIVEEYECARTSRRWKVVSPENHGQKNAIKNGKKTGSKSDPVQNEPGQSLTQARSNLDPLTGSKMNPYKERDPKEKSKNSLSSDSEIIRSYFDSVLAYRKRESEKQAYQGLKTSFSDAQIELCLNHLQTHGTPGTHEPCHSPMAFLGRAMSEVLRVAEGDRAKAEARAERNLRDATEKQILEQQDAAERDEWKIKEKAFFGTFLTEEEREKTISELCLGTPFRSSQQSGRSYAIGTWWNEFKTGKSIQSNPPEEARNAPSGE
jgi:hypothetical protein